MLKLCLIICGLLAFVNPCKGGGWMKPRYMNTISRLDKHIRDDRCKQFQIFTQKVDHFGFANMDTYEQRYIINKDHWENGRPIFFYAGNEGSNDDGFSFENVI
jgi:hypothetical protein